MKDIRRIHREAMILLKKAEDARNDGDTGGHTAFLRQAFLKETEAAEALKDLHEMEPTRSVLYRSAAVLAFRLEEFEQGQSLIMDALRGEPFQELKEELEQLLAFSQNALKGETAIRDNALSAIIKAEKRFLPLDPEDALRFIRGVNKAANAIKVTMGPKGRNVVIEKLLGPPAITKDGITIAREIELVDPVENMGAQLVKGVAGNTVDIAGDGTTTAAILTQAIVKAGMKSILAGTYFRDLKRGIDYAVEKVITHLKNQSLPIEADSEWIIQVARTAANNDQAIAGLVATALGKVGRNGVITIEEGKGFDSFIELKEGMQFDQGYVSPYFVTDAEKMEAVLQHPYILVCDKKVDNMHQMLAFLDEIVASRRSLLIIADNLDAQVLLTLQVNKLQGILQVAAVKAPGTGENKRELLQDIAVFTGAALISDHLGTATGKINLSMLGQASSVIIGQRHTTIIGGEGDKAAITARMKEIGFLLAAGPSKEDRKILEERRAKLSNGMAVLHVGAVTDLERKEKMDRVEDAVLAAKAALEEGIVPGGGAAFIKAQEALENIEGMNEDEYTGVSIIRKTLEIPTRQILWNGGIDSPLIIQKIREGKASDGYNARTNVFEDLVAAGVIDPTKVIITALSQAAGISANYLQSSFILTSRKARV